MPAWSMTPTEANIRTNHTRVRPSMPEALTIMDLEIKPLKSGKADIDADPIKQHIQVMGMVLYNPPKSVHLIFPVT